MKNLPLRGLTVLEFSQYLSGPSAGLRLADLGARVIKIERPGSGDACRKLAIKNLWLDESSLLFHTINRNKESFAADLKNQEDVAVVKELIKKVDVVTHNFRPGIMEKVGLDYASVKKINEKIIYAEISGYGKRGPWKNKPGQDLLLQSLSGLAFTSGNKDQDPVPFGIAIADIICGTHLAQGILAALIRKRKKGIGAFIEVSLLESLLDFQFELLTTYFSSNQLPERSKHNNGHTLLSAPYGIYPTAKGFIALAMVPLSKLSTALECSALSNFEQDDAFKRRDEIKQVINKHLCQQEASHWIKKLQQNGIWAMEVLDWKQMKDQEAYRTLDMEQTVGAGSKQFITTRCPIRINAEKIRSVKVAPSLGEHNEKIKAELLNITA
jgi:crotonobetainyl-CoA:carnitine CoA-transferase CaiB-like acyl-CoA transferase